MFIVYSFVICLFGAIVSALRAFLSCSLAYLLTYCALSLSK